MDQISADGLTLSFDWNGSNPVVPTNTEPADAGQMPRQRAFFMSGVNHYRTTSGPTHLTTLSR
jgi:hypothetical protein